MADQSDRISIELRQACAWAGICAWQAGVGLTLGGHDLGAELGDDALQARHVPAGAAGVDVHLEDLDEALALQLPPHQAQNLQILHAHADADGELVRTVHAMATER